MLVRGAPANPSDAPAGWSERASHSSAEVEASEPQGDGAITGRLGEDGQLEKNKTITLSQLLDNVVILEESIKELVAIIHARRSLGIDSVRYL